MKKRIIIALSLVVGSVILATVVTAALSTRQFTANEVDFKIFIDEKEQNFNQPIVTIEDRTYLPIREFCDAAGFDINWDEEGRVVSMSDKKEFVFSDNVGISREGVLENGRKYVFYGTDKQDFNIQSYIEKMELFTSMIYDAKIQEETIEAIAEKIEVLFGLDKVPVEMAEITVYYDMKAEALLFMKDYHGVPQPGGLNVIVVNCKDGLATLYSSKMA